MRKKIKHLYILLKIGFLNIKKNMEKNYIKILLKMFPNIASGRKNFKYFKRRIKKNLILTNKYSKKTSKILPK